MHRCVAVSTLVASLFIPSRGDAADGVPTDPVVPARSVGASYGEQILILDAAAGALLFGGALTMAFAKHVETENAGAMALLAGGATYELGAPIVHAVHGSAGKAFASAGIRLGMATVGTLFGVAGPVAACLGSETGCGTCVALGASLGFVTGALGASLIDALIFAREEPADPSTAKPSLRIAPTVVLGPAPSVGITAAF